MSKEIQKLELAILSAVFRYRRVVNLKLPIISCGRIIPVDPRICGLLLDEVLLQIKVVLVIET